MRSHIFSGEIMFIVKKRFDSTKQSINFWNKSSYDILDINMALHDKGLNKEALYFSMHFVEPNMAKFYSYFEFDFNFIKQLLEIPDEYISRDTIITSELNITNVKRDASQLKLSAEKMQAIFEKTMQLLLEESKEMSEKLLIDAKKLIKQGLMKDTDALTNQPKFDFPKSFSDIDMMNFKNSLKTSTIDTDK